MFLWGLLDYRSGPRTNTELHGDWSVCKLCAWQRRVLHSISLSIVFSGVAAIIVLCLAAQAGVVTSIAMPVVLVFFPGWLPGALILAISAAGRATRYVRIRPIVDAATVVIRGHPIFAAAVAAQDVSTEGPRA
ncbi:hypothetical protein [Nocardia sp. NPDC049707]|uniref:hypothetical protein n=1 Tax=Nocardia sp. NPDC049707 TaxID=3154735 RepID=UPI00343B1141